MKSPQFSPFFSRFDQQKNLNNDISKDKQISPTKAIHNQINVIPNNSTGIVHITQQINQISIYNVIQNETPFMNNSDLDYDENKKQLSLKRAQTSETIGSNANESQNMKFGTNIGANASASDLNQIGITSSVEPLIDPEGIENNDIEGSSIKKNEKRKSLPRDAKDAMKNWLIAHWAYPYPSIKEKKMFSYKYGLTERQVTIYFINNRTRVLKRKGWGSKKASIDGVQFMKFL